MIRQLISVTFDGLLQVVAILSVFGITIGTTAGINSALSLGLLQMFAVALVATVLGFVLTAFFLGPIFVLLDIRDAVRRRH